VEKIVTVTKTKIVEKPYDKVPPLLPSNSSPPPNRHLFLTQPKTTELHLPLFLSPSFIPRVLAALGKREPSPNVPLPDTSERLSHVSGAAEKSGRVG